MEVDHEVDGAASDPSGDVRRRPVEQKMAGALSWMTPFMLPGPSTVRSATGLSSTKLIVASPETATSRTNRAWSSVHVPESPLSVKVSVPPRSAGAALAPASHACAIASR